MIPLSTENESMKSPCRFQLRTATITNDDNCVIKGVSGADRAHMIPLSTENESVGSPCRFQLRNPTGATYNTTPTTTTTTTNDADCV